MKSREELPMKVTWFQYEQLKSLFEDDKNNYGFTETNPKLEEILLGSESKTISKIYKQLLTWCTEDEVVKNTMIK